MEIPSPATEKPYNFREPCVASSVVFVKGVVVMNVQELRSLGWKPAFHQQLTDDEEQRLLPVRIAAHLRSHLLCLSATDEFPVPVALTLHCGELTVGDWLLLEPETHRGVRRLERQTVLARRAAGERPHTQLIAANLDTLFILSACDHDFNLSRLERYLSLAAEADIDPVVVLTKADLCDDPDFLRQEARTLKRNLIVETIDARDPVQANVLSDWCGVGQTIALVGSSGVGKSTLAMSLGAPSLATQEVREDDSKGRHTTTTRWIHRLDAGGLLIDTPGMRELQLADCEQGVAEVFDDVARLAEACRFADCSHQSEPDCAVRAAIESGNLDPRRLKNFLKLASEQARNAKSLRQLRHESRKQGQFYKSVLSTKRQQRYGDD
jgi:ribosome biogenesis GTPase